MLDRWICGDVNRLSPEAPVPVLVESYDYYSLGGAANVARNIKMMTDDVFLYGNVGTDDSGHELVALLMESNINCMLSKVERTTTKTRLVTNSGQHILRWDKDFMCCDDDPVMNVVNDIKEDDLIVVSDYAKGAIKQDTVKLLSKNNLVFVDPKKKAETYDGAFLVKPNMKEYVSWNGNFDVDSAIAFMNKHSWSWLVITDGENGIHVLKDTGGYFHYIEPSDEISDVTGAGDVVMSVIVGGFYSGLDIPDACENACHVATNSVERKGTSVVNVEDVFWE